MRYLFTWEIKDYISEIEKNNLNPVDCFYISSYNEVQQLKEIYKNQWIEYKIIRINQPYFNKLKDIIQKEYWHLSDKEKIEKFKNNFIKYTKQWHY